MKGVAPTVTLLVAAPRGRRRRDAVGDTRPLDGRPDAVVDLDTEHGLRLVRGSWAVREVTLAPATFRRAAPDLTPTGPEAPTFDVGPDPGRRRSMTPRGYPCPPGGCTTASARPSSLPGRLRAVVPDAIGDLESPAHRPCSRS